MNRQLNRKQAAREIVIDHLLRLKYRWRKEHDELQPTSSFVRDIVDEILTKCFTKEEVEKELQELGEYWGDQIR